MTPYIFWLCEFLLEALGAVYAFRKKLGSVSLYLAFRAAADFLCALVMVTLGQDAYCWADYGQRVIQYALFGIVCIRASAAVLRSDEHTGKFYSGMAFLLWLAGTVYFHFFAPLTMLSLLKFESGVHILMGAFLSVAMFSGSPGKTWKQIAHGLLILASSDALLAIAQAHHWKVEGLYPLGAITGLGLMLWAVSRKEQAGVSGEVRLCLGMRTVER